jgi:hypothetical protein
MTEERVPYESSGVGSISLPSNGMAVCVLSAAGLQPTFTTYLAGVEIPTTGENVTSSWSAYAEAVTHTGMRSDDS